MPSVATHRQSPARLAGTPSRRTARGQGVPQCSRLKRNVAKICESGRMPSRGWVASDRRGAQMRDFRGWVGAEKFESRPPGPTIQFGPAISDTCEHRIALRREASRRRHSIARRGRRSHRRARNPCPEKWFFAKFGQLWVHKHFSFGSDLKRTSFLRTN